MVISPRKARIALFVLGMVALTPALFMAQVFWGVHLAFALFSIFSPPDAVVGFFVLSFSGAASAALPFGILFGLASPDHT
jgi:hypothetical protein